MKNKIVNFYFGPALSPGAFLARGFLGGVTLGIIVGMTILLLS